ncbi:MAG: hypothetical protein VYC64_03415, partial [Candidatus Latescibacterota bacterium]|nr:hypothetical protein [Candidatus Latescibacterota bacterium]
HRQDDGYRKACRVPHTPSTKCITRQAHETPDPHLTKVIGEIPHRAQTDRCEHAQQRGQPH